MIVETGHYALVLALAVALVQMVVPVWGVRRGDAGLRGMAMQRRDRGSSLLIAYSFAALAYAHVGSDFSPHDRGRELPVDRSR